MCQEAIGPRVRALFMSNEGQMSNDGQPEGQMSRICSGIRRANESYI